MYGRSSRFRDRRSILPLLSDRCIPRSSQPLKARRVDQVSHLSANPFPIGTNNRSPFLADRYLRGTIRQPPFEQLFRCWNRFIFRFSEGLPQIRLPWWSKSGERASSEVAIEAISTYEQVIRQIRHFLGEKCRVKQPAAVRFFVPLIVKLNGRLPLNRALNSAV